MSETIIKFIGQPSRKKPQLFPLNGKSFDDGDFAIMNFEVYEELEGNIETNKYGNISIRGYDFPPDYDISKQYIILATLDGIDPTYGKQWDLLMCNESIDLSDVWQQKIFLQAFITDLQIKNLYDTLEDPMKSIERHNMNDLTSVKGIGKSTAEKIIEKYEDNKDYSVAYVELSSYGLSPNMIKKLCNIYHSADALVRKIKDNPYILAGQVKGIGFATVDEMALNAGIPRLSDIRLEAYIKHILNEGAQQGFSWITSTVLINKIEGELDIFPMDTVVSVVNSMKSREILYDGKIGIIALREFYELELKIAKEIERIDNGETTIDTADWEGRVKQAEKLNGYDYTDEQKSAIKVVLDNNVSIISGGAGTGKTTTVLGALKALGDIMFMQCALSGCASARLEEATGYDSATIHRTLGVNPKLGEGMFVHNKKNPLSTDVVVLDEFSMVGGVLFLNLLEAVPTGAKLVMIGDINQLPAIGALNVANDLIKSPNVNVGWLTQIHRQSAKSGVIVDAHKVKNGEQIADKNFIGKELRGELKDFEIDIYDNSALTAGKAIQHFREKLAICKDVMDVQLIAPVRVRGHASVYALNQTAQSIYNPPNKDKPEVYLSIDKDKGYILRKGDKVINVVNNYEMEVFTPRNDFVIENNIDEYIDDEVIIEEMHMETTEVFNGYIGTIVDIIDSNLIVEIPLINKTVIITDSHWKGDRAVELAYAITVHKVQGQSIPYPICVLDYSHYMMLSRELLYTAITRSSKHCTLVAENKALRKAINTTSVQTKQTFLVDLLDEIYG